MSYSARKPDNYNSRFFWIAHISGDGRDLAILTTSNRVLLYQDFERIRRGEIGPVAAGRVLRLLPGTRCLSLAFEQRRLCIATVRVFLRISRYLHSCPLPLFPRSFMRFTSSTSREVRVIPSTGQKPWSCDPTYTRLLRRVIPSTGQKPWSCDPTYTRLLRRIASSAACSSPTDAFTLRGKTRGVGTFHCSKTRKILGQSPRHTARPSSLKRHG